MLSYGIVGLQELLSHWHTKGLLGAHGYFKTFMTPISQYLLHMSNPAFIFIMNMSGFNQNHLDAGFQGTVCSLALPSRQGHGKAGAATEPVRHRKALQYRHPALSLFQ
jgi:hypothetical protein